MTVRVDRRISFFGSGGFEFGGFEFGLRDGFFAFPRLRAADDDGDSLPGFDGFSGARILVNNRVRLRVRRIARSPHAHIQSGLLERVFGGKAVVADDFRDIDFGAAKTVIDCSGDARDEQHSTQREDRESSESAHNSLRE